MPSSSSVEKRLTAISEEILLRMNKALTQSFRGPLCEDLRDHVSDLCDTTFPIRGALVYAGYRLAGGRCQEIMEIATATELAKIATVVIDDIVDQADVREGRTAHEAFGLGPSILLGEILKARASRLFADCVASTPAFANRFVAHRRFELTYEKVCLGQLLDLRLETASTCSESQYLSMVRLATAGFLEGSVDVGSLLAGAPSAITRPLRRYAVSIGTALQIIDDVHDLSTEHATGKTFALDLKRRKKRLPLIHLLRSCTRSERASIIRILRKSQINDRDVRRILKLMEIRGSLSYALRRARQYYQAAAVEIYRITSNEDRSMLEAILNIVKNGNLDVRLPAVPKAIQNRSARSRNS